MTLTSGPMFRLYQKARAVLILSSVERISVSNQWQTFLKQVQVFLKQVLTLGSRARIKLPETRAEGWLQLEYISSRRKGISSSYWATLYVLKSNLELLDLMDT